jgi:tetratricopeptide (TPR) repeat protein
VQSYFEVPNRRVIPFFGREDIISKIDRAFSVGPGPRVIVVQGMGGQGKSQVAMEYCHQKKDDPFSAIFWIDAASESSVMRTFISISRLISTPIDQLPDNDARIAFVSRKLASWPIRLLLVFDNYDDPEDFPNIRDFFPPNELGAILVTGRHADIGTLVLSQGANLIELPGLEEPAAVELLEHYSQINETTRKFGGEIVKRLGYHPLAITQAGTYIRKGGIQLSEFMDIYNQEKEEILKNTPQLSQYRRKLEDAEKETSLNVFTTWQLSFQQLLSRTPEDSVAVMLLRLLAFFDSKDVSEWTFIEYHRNHLTTKMSKLLEWINRFTDSQSRWNSRLFKKNLALLKDFCLLQSFTQGPDEYSHVLLHPLVKDWIRLQMGESACQVYALMVTKILGDLLQAVWRSDQFELPLTTKQYLALHVIAQEDNYKEYLGIHYTELHQDVVDEYTIGQAWLGLFLKSLGLYSNAEPIEVRVMETSLRVLGEEHPGTLTSMNNLASTFRNQGRWKEAEELEVQVMETRKRVLGEEHPDTLTSMANLASTFRNQGRWKEAEELEVQVTETSLRVLGEEHPNTLNSIANLASTFWNQGRWKEAEELFVQVVETSLRVRGEEHPDTLNSMANLASTFRNQGRWKEAEELKVQVMETRKRVLGEEHPDTLSSMNNLAHTYRDLDRIEKAVELMVKVVQLRSKVLGPNHPYTTSSEASLMSWTST